MIEITETAARKIKSLMAKQGITDGGLRVGVKGGGCSGLSYTFAWEKQARLGDEVFEGHGAKIFVDKKSLLFLTGMFSLQTVGVYYARDVLDAERVGTHLAVAELSSMTSLSGPRRNSRSAMTASLIAGPLPRNLRADPRQPHRLPGFFPRTDGPPRR